MCLICKFKLDESYTASNGDDWEWLSLAVVGLSFSVVGCLSLRWVVSGCGGSVSGCGELSLTAVGCLWL